MQCKGVLLTTWCQQLRRADRLLSLLELLRSADISKAAALAAALEVSQRTVYRDIAALVRTGVPIRGEAGVGYMLEPGYYLPPLNLTPEEAEVLCLGARILGSWSDDAVAAKAASALRKIRAVLPAPSLQGVDSDIFWAPPWVTRHPPKVDLLMLKRAAERRQVLEIDYRSLDGTPSSRAVRPLSLSFFGAVWLLVAWCERKEDFRCFRIDRIEAIRPAGRGFRNEPGKRLADFKSRKGEEALARLSNV